ncbi:unnamed protein product, partial [Mesorhabditis belari]|uniref:C-type lectin domain-containing protein n=1 Tax=Mesorhabditis belari TaxID=2138241 RepID=A0AAF3EM72_9BILA
MEITERNGAISQNDRSHLIKGILLLIFGITLGIIATVAVFQIYCKDEEIQAVRLLKICRTELTNAKQEQSETARLLSTCQETLSKTILDHKQNLTTCLDKHQQLTKETDQQMEKVIANAKQEQSEPAKLLSTCQETLSKATFDHKENHTTCLDKHQQLMKENDEQIEKLKTSSKQEQSEIAKLLTTCQETLSKTILDHNKKLVGVSGETSATATPDPRANGWTYFEITKRWYKTQTLLTLKSYLARNNTGSWWLWIGLERSLRDPNKFQWTDWSSVEYQNWSPDEPNTLSETGVAMNLRHPDLLATWNDLPAGLNTGHTPIAFICKKT